MLNMKKDVLCVSQALFSEGKALKASPAVAGAKGNVHQEHVHVCTDRGCIVLIVESWQGLHPSPVFLGVY